MKIEVNENFLIELKLGLYKAIYHEDGLDGAEGISLINTLNDLLGVEDEKEELIREFGSAID